MIHLVFGAAAARSLKHGLRKSSHKIIGFPIDLSVGPITNIHKQSGINYYFTWLKSSYRPGWNYCQLPTTYRSYGLIEVGACKRKAYSCLA